MREWLSAQDIADAGLPDLPTSKMGVAMLAKRERWDEHPSFVRPRRGRGGGLEYHYRILPTLARIAWFERHEMVVKDPMPVGNCGLPPARAETARAKRERDARMAILAAFERFSSGLGLRHMSRLQVFCDKYNLGNLAIDPWVKESVPSLSKRSLDRWRAKAQAGELLGHDPGLSRKGTGVLERANGGRVMDWMLALVAANAHFTAAHIRTQCRHQFGDTLDLGDTCVPMPPVRAFQRALKALKADNRVLLTRIADPDRYRSTMAASGTGSLRHITTPNALWQIDASPADVLLVDGRHSVYVAIDIASRRLCITVSKTPRASAVALLIRKAVLTWGVPAQIKTDNGSDFVAQETARLFAALGIETIVSDAYSPEQKGHVERAIRTFQHDFAVQLPGFSGHNVAEAQALRARKSFADRLGESDSQSFAVALTAAELQARIDDWLELIYQHRPHAGLGQQTPHAVAASASFMPRLVDARVLDVLLMPVAGTRQVTRFGVRVEKHHYSSPHLLVGQTVLVRRDPLDMGKVLIFSADGAQFLAEAICPELAGIHPATYWQAFREEKSRLESDAARRVKADMRAFAKGPSAIERALEVARRDVPNVVALPRRGQKHETPQTEAAAMARATPEPSGLSERVAAVHRTLQQQAMPAAAASTVRMLRAQDGKHQRYARARDIEQRVANGAPVTDAERGWLDGYRQSPEYRSMQTFHTLSAGSLKEKSS